MRRHENKMKDEKINELKREMDHYIEKFVKNEEKLERERVARHKFIDFHKKEVERFTNKLTDKGAKESKLKEEIHQLKKSL